VYIYSDFRVTSFEKAHMKRTVIGKSLTFDAARNWLLGGWLGRGMWGRDLCFLTHESKNDSWMGHPVDGL
jgi:hypothetical protein